MRYLHRLDICLFAFAILLMIAACTSGTEIESSADDTLVPVQFDTYTSTTKTRAVDANATNITNNEDLKNLGFGVFAYYTDNARYTDIPYDAPSGAGTVNTEFLPNFMFNQKISWNKDKSVWEYAPLKYWPNEYGQDGAEGTDRVSFFAYAPHSSSVDEGLIKTVITNESKSDPIIEYSIPDNEEGTGTDVRKCVDILVGINKDTRLPNTNMTKQKISENVNFAFKHVLSKFAIDVRGVFDEVSAGSNSIDSYRMSGGNAYGTKITLESIKISNITLPKTGRVNLYTGKWERTNTESELYFKGASINDELKDLGETAAKNASTNSSALPAGVTHVAKNIFSGDRNYTLVPPMNENNNVQVEITYYVNTYDPSLILTNGVSRVKNVITNVEPLSIAFEEGKSYTLHILLGMTTVKFSVEVEDWKEPIIFNPSVEEWEKEEPYDKENPLDLQQE